MLKLGLGHMNMSINDFNDLSFEEFCIKCEGFNERTQMEEKDRFFNTYWLWNNSAMMQASESGQKKLKANLEEFTNKYLGIEGKHAKKSTLSEKEKINAGKALASAFK